MNGAQRTTLKVGLAIISMMAIVPPWQVKIRGDVVYDTGYGFVFDPPRSPVGKEYPSTVNLGRLLVQGAAVASLTALVMLSLPRKDGPRRRSRHHVKADEREILRTLEDLDDAADASPPAGDRRALGGGG